MNSYVDMLDFYDNYCIISTPSKTYHVSLLSNKFQRWKENIIYEFHDRIHPTVIELAVMMNRFYEDCHANQWHLIASELEELSNHLEYISINDSLLKQLGNCIVVLETEKGNQSSINVSDQVVQLIQKKLGIKVQPVIDLSLNTKEQVKVKKILNNSIESEKRLREIRKNSKIAPDWGDDYYKAMAKATEQIEEQELRDSQLWNDHTKYLSKK